MSDYLGMISSLDKEINDIMSQYGNEAAGEDSPQSEENIKDSTKENVVDVTSKNFVSAKSSNVIQSPFIRQQQSLKHLTLLQQGSGSGQDDSKVSEITHRIMSIFKF